MRKFSLLLVFGLFGLFINAQNFSFGPKAGMNISTFRGEDSYDFQYKPGWHIGVFGELSLTNWFALQGELLYSRQGAQHEITISDFGSQTDPSLNQQRVDVNINLDYINLPILAKFHPAPEINLFLGPQVGFLVSAEEKISEGEYKSEMDISEMLRDMDFGLLFGVGYDFDFGLVFQARYYWGLTNINKLRLVENGEVLDHPTLKNSGFQVSLGYRF